MLHDQKAIDSTWSLQKMTSFAGWSLRLLESNLGLDLTRYLFVYLMLIAWLDSGNSTRVFTCRKQGINFACWHQEDFYSFKCFYINSYMIKWIGRNIIWDWRLKYWYSIQKQYDFVVVSSWKCVCFASISEKGGRMCRSPACLEWTERQTTDEENMCCMAVR